MQARRSIALECLYRRIHIYTNYYTTNLMLKLAQLYFKVDLYI